MADVFKHDMLTFKRLRERNVQRCNMWHRGGLDDWSLNDWMTALVGEVGEAANILKKLKRIEDELPNVSSRNVLTKEEGMVNLADELADTMIYLDLLAARAGINLEQAVVKKFNEVSDRYNLPVKL